MTLKRALVAVLAFDVLVLLVVLVSGFLERRSDAAGEGLKAAYTVFIALPVLVAIALALVPATPARWAALVVGSLLPLALAWQFAEPLWAPVLARREATGASRFRGPARRLAAAIHAGDTALLRRLAAEPGADLDAEGRDRRTLLVFAFSRNPALVPFLLELGADPNHRSSDGELPLEAALEEPIPETDAAAAQPGLVRALLAGGARPGERTRFDRPLVEHAVRLRRPDLAAMLLDAGADVATRGENDWTLPMFAVQARKWAMAADLLRRGAPVAHEARYGVTLARVYAEALELVAINTTPEELQLIEAFREAARERGLVLPEPTGTPGP